VVADYLRRWSIELLIKDEKQHLGLGAYRVLRYRAVVRHLHLVDAAYACLTHVGLKAQRAQGQKKTKRVLRLPPIRQLKADLQRAVWNEAVKDVVKASHERPVLRRLEKLLAA
jgi:SRSO17 transposase